jgi:hypothetical protein
MAGDSFSSDAPFELSKELRELLPQMGANVGDVIRVLRPGGPLDEIAYRSVCTSCNGQKTASLRRFYERDLVCDCGGKFDATASESFVEALRNRDMPTTRRVFAKSFERIQHDP